MRQIFSICLLAVGVCASTFTSRANATDHLNAIIQAAPANSWYEVPSSKLTEDLAEDLDSDSPGIWPGNFNRVRGVFVWGSGERGMLKEGHDPLSRTELILVRWHLALPFTWSTTT